MNYQIILNDKEILHGDVVVFFVILLLLIIIFVYIVRVIISKIRAYEVMKYEFITIIAHKFRTPLTQIKWIIEGLILTEQDSFKKDSLINLGKSNESLIGLTNTLVELTDSEEKGNISYNFEKTNICDFINRVADNIKDRFHAKNIFFGIKFSAPDIFVMIDRTRMDFVIQTLIENSINYSSPGRAVEIYIITEGNRVKVSVVDHGIGISPEDLPHIFTKFFRANNAQAMDTEGFGVGLYLASSIIKLHRGRIEVSSSGLNNGATFTMTLPLAK